MLRRLVASAAVLAAGLSTAGPAWAAPTLAASGDATAISATGADLHGVVYRERAGARWFFEWSTDPRFDLGALTTPPVALHGRLVAVARAISGLSASTTYYWRVGVLVRQGRRTMPTFGTTRTLSTAAPPAPDGTTPPAGSSTTGTSTTPAPDTGTSTTPAF